MKNKNSYPIDLNLLLKYFKDHNINEFDTVSDIINKFGDDNRCNGNNNKCRKYGTKEVDSKKYCHIHYDLLINNSVKRQIGYKCHELKRLIKIIPDNYIEKIKDCIKYRTYKIRYCKDGYDVITFLYISTDDNLKNILCNVKLTKTR